MTMMTLDPKILLGISLIIYCIKLFLKKNFYFQLLIKQAVGFNIPFVFFDTLMPALRTMFFSWSLTHLLLCSFHSIQPRASCVGQNYKYYVFIHFFISRKTF